MAEIQISVFGPGYGECILLGLGEGWIIVDSCLNEQKQAAAIDYLRSIGSDPATEVLHVIATHWHDDHIGGLAEVVRACPSAQFWCSGALKREEFLALTQVRPAQRLKSGVQEFSEILSILETRANLNQPNHRPHFAFCDRRLWHRPATATVPECEIFALSPSDDAQLAGYREIAALLEQTKLVGASTKIPSINPNHVAVVLWIRVGTDVALLLGSDLEETRNPAQGWSAILASSGRPKQPASLFKVPHHGSRTGHLDGVWSSMLTAEPISLLTPFVRGSVKLPTTSDANRICSLTPHAFVSAQPSPKAKRRPAQVARTIQNAARVLRALPSMGQIIARRNGDKWATELSGGAVALAQLAKK